MSFDDQLDHELDLEDRHVNIAAGHFEQIDLDHLDDEDDLIGHVDGFADHDGDHPTDGEIRHSFGGEVLVANGRPLTISREASGGFEASSSSEHQHQSPHALAADAVPERSVAQLEYHPHHQQEEQTSSVGDGGNGEGLTYEFSGFDDRYSIRWALYWLGCVLSGGILFIIGYWLPDLAVRLSYPRVSLRSATLLVVRNTAALRTMTSCLTSQTKDKSSLFLCPVTTTQLSIDERIVIERRRRRRQQQQQQAAASSDDSEFDPLDELRQKNVLDNTGTVKIAVVAHQQFFYDWQSDTFKAVPFPVALSRRAAARLDLECLSGEDASKLRNVFGTNEMEVEMPSIGELLLSQVIHPFYIFQVLSVTLWMINSYWGYAIVIAVAATLSAVSTVYEIRQNARRLREIARFHSDVKVLRRGADGREQYESLPSRELVPGDVILLEDRQVLPCDLQVLGRDANLIVNEAMLTGESVPVVKGGVLKCTDDVSDSLLYGGTSISQARPSNSCYARVLTTGFATAKGELMRAILHGGNSERSEEFYRQGFMIVGILFIVAFIGVFVNVGFMTVCVYSEDANPVKRVADTLDVITIAVAPALPVALSVGIAFALIRLRKKQIFCISPPSINLAGRIEIACFDKTGTLTQDLIQLHSLIDTAGHEFPREQVPKSITRSHCVFLVLASCHSLTVLEDDEGEEIIGDTLELAMYESLMGKDPLYPIQLAISDESTTVVWREGPQAFHIEILHRFPFASKLQRMSCLVRVNHSRDFILMKGSPEVVIGTFCRSTDIEPVDQSWQRYTKSGYRVLSCAVRMLDDPEETNSILSPENPDSRDMAERAGEFSYCGSLVFENPLKPESQSTIEELKSNNIRPVMITGDHPLTGLHVARECGFVQPQDSRAVGYMCTTSELVWVPIVDGGHTNLHHQLQPQQQQQQQHDTGNGGGDALQHPSLSCKQIIDLINSSEPTDQPVLVISGPAFAALTTGLSAEEQASILGCCSVYARMKPDQKCQLVTYYQGIARTSMTGDGSNDCAALKQADVGLSLSSEAEATMAAPFTSASPSPHSFIMLLREGRAALVTSFQCFKFIVFYSMIQFFGVEILYSRCAIYGNWHYLLQDLFSVLPLAITMSRTEAADALSLSRPPGVLFSFQPMCSLVLQSLLIFLSQVAGLYIFTNSPGFIPLVNDGLEMHAYSYETWFLQHFAMLQYIFICVSLSVGRPHRKEMWTNPWFLWTTIFLFFFELWLLFFQPVWLVTIFQFVIVPTFLSVVTFILAIIYGVIAFITEWAISNSTLTFSAIRNFAGPWLLPASCCRGRSQYETLE